MTQENAVNMSNEQAINILKSMMKRLKAWDTNDATDKALYNFALNRVLEAPTVEPERKWIPSDWLEKRMKELGYKGCRNCTHQVEPMRGCEWLERGGDGVVHLICPRWERRTDGSDRQTGGC